MKIEDQKSHFYGWYDIAIPMGKPVFSEGRVSAPEMQPELRKWLNSNIGLSGRTTWVHGGCDKYGRHIIIKSGEKAMMFKLAWS